MAGSIVLATMGLLLHADRLWELSVALAGLLLPMNWAVGCAVLIPVLNTTFFAEPYLTTDLPLLVCQLIALAAFTNFFNGMLGWKAIEALPLALALSLVVLFCAASIYAAVSSGFARSVLYLTENIATGWRRMLLEILVVPPVAWIVKRIASSACAK